MVALLASLALPGSAGAVSITNTSRPTWISNNAIEAVEPSTDGKSVYVGGKFNYLGPATGSSVRLDDGSIVTPNIWPMFRGGNVNDIVPDDQNGPAERWIYRTVSSIKPKAP